MTTLPDCAKALRAILAPLGFVRKSSTWRRDTGEFVDVIEFQRGKTSADFTLNIGVLTKSVYTIAWSKEAPDLPKEAACTVRARIGSLIFQGDKWWEIDDPAALPEIAGHVLSSVLPFLDHMHSREQQLNFLRERSTWRGFWQVQIYAAILMFECGQREEACAKLRKHQPTRYEGASIQARFGEVADRLNCPKL